MPGARLASFRLGDRSELLVEHLLAGFAFTTRVPRQEDIGIDFLCSLITAYDGAQLLKAGAFFGVQAKSSAEKLVYEKPHELEWITSQENPILLCVADRTAAAMDVYSTSNLLCGVLGGGWQGKMKPNRIALCPGETGDWPGIRNNEDGSQEVLLGKPIIHITHNDLVDEKRTKEIAQVIGSWVLLDRVKIVNRGAGMYWVVGPNSYETGEPPKAERLASYWNPENLEKYTLNLCRSEASLWLLLRRHPQISSRINLEEPPWPEGLVALREMVRWCRVVLPPLQGLLGDLDTEDLK
jgi:hypothetical protein